MSQPAVAALAPLPFELVYDDGEPLETEWHTWELPLLRELMCEAMEEQGRTDFYAGMNMFVYYSVEQAREVALEVREGKVPRTAFRGPDVFWVGGIDSRNRKVWVSWEEGGRLPDVIFEMSSPSTAEVDRTVKKDLYARVFRAKEYFLYDPDTGDLEGFDLALRAYQPKVPDEQGRLWSAQLGVFVGVWHGKVKNKEYDWIRLFRSDGSLVPTADERAEAERERAEAERERAEAAEQRAETAEQRAEAAEQLAEVERERARAAETELARLRALLEERSKLPRE